MEVTRDPPKTEPAVTSATFSEDEAAAGLRLWTERIGRPLPAGHTTFLVRRAGWGKREFALRITEAEELPAAEPEASGKLEQAMDKLGPPKPECATCFAYRPWPRPTDAPCCTRVRPDDKSRTVWPPDPVEQPGQRCHYWRPREEPELPPELAAREYWQSVKARLDDPLCPCCRSPLVGAQIPAHQATCFVTCAACKRRLLLRRLAPIPSRIEIIDHPEPPPHPLPAGYGDAQCCQHCLYAHVTGGDFAGGGHCDYARCRFHGRDEPVDCTGVCNRFAREQPKPPPTAEGVPLC